MITIFAQNFIIRSCHYVERIIKYEIIFVKFFSDFLHYSNKKTPSVLFQCFLKVYSKVTKISDLQINLEIPMKRVTLVSVFLNKSSECGSCDAA